MHTALVVALLVGRIALVLEEDEQSCTSGGQSFNTAPVVALLVERVALVLKKDRLPVSHVHRVAQGAGSLILLFLMQPDLILQRQEV